VRELGVGAVAVARREIGPRDEQEQAAIAFGGRRDVDHARQLAALALRQPHQARVRGDAGAGHGREHERRPGAQPLERQPRRVRSVGHEPRDLGRGHGEHDRVGRERLAVLEPQAAAVGCDRGDARAEPQRARASGQRADQRVRVREPIEPERRVRAERGEQELAAGLARIDTEQRREERCDALVEHAPAEVHATEVGDADVERRRPGARDRARRRART
jgi:hypothetical protein